MDTSSIVIFVICILFIIVSTLKVMRGLFLLILQSFNMQPIYRKINPKYQPYLNRYFKFYRNLDSENKALFEKRVQFFIDIKNFIPRGGLKEVSPEVKALIAGSAIQITYGYPNVYFRYFNKILIYPDKYFSKLTKQYHKGEVNVKGIIVLSLKSLMYGWVNDNDGVNLGLHEMAHALSIENLVRNSEFNFIDAQAVRDLKELAYPEMEKIKQKQSSIFRSYGSTNFREFFSVAIEVFFEQPDEFKMYHIEMFNAMVKILNVNPLDYKN